MNQQSGFTLIELLVAAIIIGVISTIAFANYQNFKSRNFDATVKSDLHNAATAQETYFVDSDSYASCSDKDDCISVLPSIDNFSPELTISMDGTVDYFTGEATSAVGTGAIFSWDSREGGLQDD